MDRDGMKVILSWTMIILSVFVMATTLRSRYGSSPMLPQLVPLFGTLFVLLYLAAQIGSCYLMRSKMGFLWLAGGLLLGFIGGSVGEFMMGQEPNTVANQEILNVLKAQGNDAVNHLQKTYDWTRHKMIAGVCISGLILGMGFLKAKI